MVLQLQKTWSWNRVSLRLLLGALIFIVSGTYPSGGVSNASTGPLRLEDRVMAWWGTYEHTDPPYWVRSSCSIQSRVVVSKSGDSRLRDLCITDGRSASIGEAINGPMDRYISFKGDKKYYEIVNFSGESADIYMVSGTDKLFIFWNTDEGLMQDVYVYDDFTKIVTKHIGGHAYTIGERVPGIDIGNGATTKRIYGWGVSGNGRFLVYGTRESLEHDATWYDGVRVDTWSGDWRRFGFTDYFAYDVRAIRNSFAVTDDGGFIAEVTYMGRIRVVQADDNCLVERLSTHITGQDHLNCPVVYHGFHNRLAYGRHIPMNLTIDSSGRYLDHIIYHHDTGVKGGLLRRLRLGDTLDTNRLDYLAMGDSYSSGEGDIQKGVSQHYINNTHGVGDCHISSRSYPFLLQDIWSIPSSKIKSIACSGARVAHDYISRIEYYDGQSGRLRNKVGPERSNLQDEALRDFQPGIIPQIEFVREYKPKIITLTGGGNDIGFADILEACASPNFPNVLEFNFLVDESCSYANNSTVKQTIKNAMAGQYGVTKLLIRKIKEASYDSEVYIIGYPQFIKGGTALCGLNPGSLNSKERAAITGMVEDFNRILQLAAIHEGATFIDIEDSLEGGRLCEGGRYMTGLADISFDLGRNKQQAFHPNHLGHRRIAQVVNSEISRARQDDDVPTSQGQDGAVYESAPYTQRFDIGNGAPIPRDAPLMINPPSTYFQPNSSVNIMIYSDPVDLGDFTVDNRGLLSAEVAIPEDMAPGHHTVIITGVSMSGEQVVLYSPVLIATDSEMVTYTQGLSCYSAEADGSVDDCVAALKGSSVANGEMGDELADSSSGMQLASTGWSLYEILLLLPAAVVLVSIRMRFFMKGGHINGD